MTPELLVKSLKTAQQWICLSCDIRLEADSFCRQCEAQTMLEVKTLEIAGVGAYRHTSKHQRVAIPSAIPMVAPNSQIPQIHKSTVFQPKVCVYRITGETDDVEAETDAEKIKRLHEKGYSIRKIEALTNSSLGKIRYHINKAK